MTKLLMIGLILLSVLNDARAEDPEESAFKSCPPLSACNDALSRSDHITWLACCQQEQEKELTQLKKQVNTERSQLLSCSVQHAKSNPSSSACERMGCICDIDSPQVQIKKECFQGAPLKPCCSSGGDLGEEAVATLDLAKITDRDLQTRLSSCQTQMASKQPAAAGGVTAPLSKPGSGTPAGAENANTQN